MGQSGSPEGDVEIVARTEGRSGPAKGDVVGLAPKPGRLHLFDTTTGLRLESGGPAPRLNALST